MTVIKELLSGEESTTFGRLTLKPCCQPWVEGRSLADGLVRLTKNHRNTLEDILKPTLPWYAKLESLSMEQGDVRWVDGGYLDAIWSNTFVDGERVEFIDLEWECQGTIRLSYVVIRSFYDFFRDRREKRAFDFQARRGSLRSIIKDAARMYGLRITSDDFRYFLSMSLELEQASLGDKICRFRRTCAMNWRLCTNPSANLADSLLGKARWFINKLRKHAAVRSSRD
jgi:hypothetical protein